MQTVRVECISPNQFELSTERIRPKFLPVIENLSPVKSPQLPRAPYGHAVWWTISDTVKWTPLVYMPGTLYYSGEAYTRKHLLDYIFESLSMLDLPFFRHEL